MICREFIRKTEALPLSELCRASDVEWLAHQRECSGCAHWLQQQHELAGALHSVAAGMARLEAPSRIEQNVLRAFRQSAVPIEQRGPLRHGFTWRLSRLFEIGAYAAAAAALAISLAAGGWYLHQHEKASGNSAEQKTFAQPVQAAAQQRKTAQASPRQEPERAAQQAAKAVTATAGLPSASVPLLVKAQQAQGYTPMMLCDPLSCSGDEQVVRMELPTSDSSQEAQLADVIIGDDGLVRAIRIVPQ